MAAWSIFYMHLHLKIDQTATLILTLLQLRTALTNIATTTPLDDQIDTADFADTFQSILDLVKQCDVLSDTYGDQGKVENAAEYLLDAQVN